MCAHFNVELFFLCAFMQLIMYIELRDVLRRFHGGADFGDQRMQPEYYLYDGRIRIYTVPGGLRPFMTVLCCYKKAKLHGCSSRLLQVVRGVQLVVSCRCSCFCIVCSV